MYPIPLAKNILKELKNGVKILNTSIPESVLKRGGLFQEQYVIPSVQDIVQQVAKLGEDANEQNDSRWRGR